MGTEWFRLDRMTNFGDLPAGAAIHVIGVSGVAMAQLAVVLSELGFKVTGSDKEFYEPMGSFLKASQVQLCHGYKAANVPDKCDLVVIGNTVSYGHPEAAVVEEGGLPYTIFPKLLFDLAIDGKHSIVVAGTHGKTTTSGMLASALVGLQAHPSFFVGGAIPGFVSGLALNSGSISVVEGDEYDSSFFAKIPKFSFYKPDSLIVNAIEFDHADIYPDLASIDREFEKLLANVPASGNIYFCADGQHELALIEKWKPQLRAPVVCFGSAEHNDIVVSSSRETDEFQRVRLSFRNLKSADFNFRLRVPGLHNAKNAAACALVLRDRGFSDLVVAEVLEKFAGVRRRQEVRFNSDAVTVIDDFAHHPTAVRETLAAIRQRYPNKKIIALFEPRSNTSRRKVFQADYVHAFKGANEVVLCLPQARNTPEPELLDVAELAHDIRTTVSIPATALPDAQSIFNFVTKSAPQNALIIVMSNGGFGGLVAQLVEFFQKTP